MGMGLSMRLSWVNLLQGGQKGQYCWEVWLTSPLLRLSSPELPHLWAGSGETRCWEANLGTGPGSSLGGQPGPRLVTETWLGHEMHVQVWGRQGGIPGHLLDAVRTVVLIVHVTSHVLEIMHVCADEHVAQLHKVAVCLVLYYRARKGGGWGPGLGSPPTPHTHAPCLDSPSTMPQGYSRPRTRCPLASTTVLLPITAKGALSWG